MPDHGRPGTAGGFSRLVMASTRDDHDAKPGDLIEIFRLGYQHWGVYVGDGYIIHLAPPSEMCPAGSSSLMSVATNKAYVRKDQLRVVAGSDRWRVNNKLDGRRTHHPPHVIVKEAHERVGTLIEYSVVSSNCQHFANQLRYGVATSPQVTEAVTNIVVGTAFLGTALACVKLFSSYRKQKE